LSDPGKGERQGLGNTAYIGKPNTSLQHKKKQTKTTKFGWSHSFKRPLIDLIDLIDLTSNSLHDANSKQEALANKRWR